MSTETVIRLLPEIILVTYAAAVFLAGAFIATRKGWNWVAALGVLLALAALSRETVQPLARGPVAGDMFGQFVRWLALAAGLPLALFACGKDAGDQAPESAGTLLLALSGLMISAAARDLVLLFVGLELISIPTYILLYLGRSGQASHEATVKYFFLSILASAVTLYGLSFLYGVGRSTDLAAIQATLAGEAAHQPGLRTLSVVALVLILGGLGFKIAAVPFHFYAPDVYQGTTAGNAALLSVLPKIAGLVALIRLLVIAMPGLEDFGWRVTLIVSILTMTVGNCLALWQDNIRRLMAYSSIAHAGYMLIGISAAFASSHARDMEMPASAWFDGTAALLTYAAVYAIATVGVFASLAWLAGDSREINGVDELSGLGRTHPLIALAVAVFMFSLAGIPPLAGFWGKLAVFASALGVDATAGNTDEWFVALAVIGGLNAAIAAAYYLRIVAVMYFRAATAPARSAGGLAPKMAALLCCLAVLLAGIAPGPLLTRSREASTSVGQGGAASIERGTIAGNRGSGP